MSQEVHKARRDRRVRNSLTVETILAAAEHVASVGFDALTIRAVATELGSSPMALYRYFATKDELVDALLNRVLGRFEQATRTGDWIVDLHTFALHHRRLLSDHPWAVIPLTTRPMPGPNAVPIGENALSILSRAGITGENAVATFSGIIALNYGWSSFVVARQGKRSIEDAQSDSPLPAVPDEYRFTVEVAEAMNRYGSADHYEHALGQLLAGIAAGGRA